MAKRDFFWAFLARDARGGKHTGVRKSGIAAKACRAYAVGHDNERSAHTNAVPALYPKKSDARSAAHTGDSARHHGPPRRGGPPALFPLPRLSDIPLLASPPCPPAALISPPADVRRALRPSADLPFVPPHLPPSAMAQMRKRRTTIWEMRKERNQTLGWAAV